MGCNLLFRCSSSPYSINNSNPDPSNFKILDSIFRNNYLLVMAQYPNCKNHEGIKVMLYKFNGTIDQLLKENNNKLDPHFADAGISPIARFKPSENGICLALALFNSLTKEFL